MPVETYGLRSIAERQRRLGLLEGDHIKPLTEFVRGVRADRGPDYQVPYFDPLDGGVLSTVLFLLEAPGPQAIASGFVSRDNPDQSAKNMAEMLAEAGLRREQTVLWNIVPWYVGDGHRIRPVNRQELAAAQLELTRLIALLPHLKAVVLVGRKAQAAEAQVKALVSLPIFNAYHPSPQVLNTTPARRDQIVDVFRSVVQAL